jgi:hypothetical protein
MDVVSIILPIGITVVVIAATVIPLALFLVPFLKRQAQASKVLQSGMSAQAQILSAQETGTRVNDQPEIAFTLMVQVPGRPPYQAHATSIMSHMMLMRVQPGMTIPVKVDPANPQSIAVDKAALSAAPMMGMGAMPGVMPGMMQQPMMPQQQIMGQQQMMPQQMMPQQMMPQQMMPQQMMPQQMMPQQMMPGQAPGGMSQQQAMALAQTCLAQPPAGGAIINCPRCGGPYAVANPFCPHCRTPRPG